MITTRRLEEIDEPLLEASLAQDEFHKTTTKDFFKQVGSFTNVYADTLGTVLYARITKSLRIDIQFCNNYDNERNRQVMLEGFPQLVETAKANGFTEVCFQSDNPMLRRFCVRRLGFYESGGELRKSI